jgi:alpha/beta hydrolase family protein
VQRVPHHEDALPVGGAMFDPPGLERAPESCQTVRAARAAENHVEELVVQTTVGVPHRELPHRQLRAPWSARAAARTYLAADHACSRFRLPTAPSAPTCISVDLRGAGQSDKPDGVYSKEQFADDIAVFMQAIGVDRAHVAGPSRGATTGM